jgi:hypothetical protein
VLIGVAGAGGVACSKAPPPAAIVIPSGEDAGEGDAGAGFTFQALGCGSAGTQSVVAVSGSKIGVASLAATTMTQTCTISPLGPVLTSQVPMWNVCYAESGSGGTFTSSVVTTQPYVGPTGVGLAFDSSGNASIAYTGVGAASEKWCGANELFVTSAKGGTFGAPVQVSNGGQSTALVAAQAGNCSQGICNTGDTTGLWPALGFDPHGNPMMAFRDVHYGFAADDFAKSDVELAEGSGATPPILDIDVARGGGSYNRLAFTPSGLPAVLQYVATGGLPGVWLDLQLVAGGLGAQEGDGGWTSSQVSTGLAGAQLGFAINAQGVFAAAYYDEGTTRLLYVESTDGATWGTPVSVDLNGSTGFYPSLAFDANGNPAIAYYRCNATSGTNCDPTQDGLYLARRTNGTWTPEAVHTDPATTDGLDPALAFVNGQAVIAFQITSFDPASQTSTSTWWVAEGE